MGSRNRQGVVGSLFHRYFIDAMGAMANGLFASLLIGTILKTVGQQFHIDKLVEIGQFASVMAGPAMAVAIGNALGASPLVLFSLVTVGYATNSMGGAGGPLAVFVISIFASEAGMLVSKKTRIDILVTPTVTILVGVGLAYLCAGYIGNAAKQLGEIIVWATEQQPLIMGVVISVVMGMVLTLPISSAAICHSFGIVGLAGGAAVAGCCAQMVGFAVASFRENRWGGVVAQGLGTSMLQVPNILRRPLIWVAPTLASAITGPLATCVFRLQMNGEAIASGMGTCGLVGPIGVYTGWLRDIALGSKAAITPMDWVGLLLICFVLPAVLTWIFDRAMRKIGWVKAGDQKLSI